MAIRAVVHYKGNEPTLETQWPHRRTQLSPSAILGALGGKQVSKRASAGEEEAKEGAAVDGAQGQRRTDHKPNHIPVPLGERNREGRGEAGPGEKRIEEWQVFNVCF